MITSTALCATTPTVTSNEIVVVVNATPVVAITDDSCVGSILTANNNMPLSSLVWKLNGSTEVSVQKPGANPDAVTIAGGNGVGSAANQFNNPNRFFYDKSGSLYVADMGNNRIQKWAPGATSGVTVAGGNGAGSAANQFDGPTSVAMDSKGNLFITDQKNSRIQKWAPGATSGSTFARYLASPTSVVIDAYDILFVSQQFLSVVTLFNTNLSIPNYTGSDIARGALDAPTGIFMDDASTLYVCDTNNDRIRKFLLGDWYGVTVAGDNGRGSGANQLNAPLGVFVDKEGNIYVADHNNARIQKWAPGATEGVTVAGGNGVGDAPNQLNKPQGVWVDDKGDIYVSDFYNHRVQKFSNGLKETYTTTTAGSYTATAISVAGCTSTSNAINVVAFKTPQVSITSNTTSVCPTITPVFTATPVNGGVAPTYQWKVNGIASAGSTASTFSTSTLISGDVVSCVITNNDNGCLTSSTAISNSIKMNNTPTEIPSVSIAVDDTVVCKGTSVTFTASPFKGGSAPTFQWKVNGTNAGSNSAIFTSTFSDGDKISCSMITNLPCAVTAPVISQTIQVTVDEPPVIKVRSDTTIFLGSSIRLVTEVSGRIDSYRWSSSATTESFTIASPLATPTASTTYKVIATTPGECKASAYITITTITEIKISNAFSPNGDGINDVWNLVGLSSYGDCSVEIFNRYGQLVFHSIGYGKPWDGTYNGKPLPVGTYYYIINTNRANGKKNGSVTILR